MECSDSERVKLSKLELVPVVGPLITISRELLGMDSNLRVKYTPKQRGWYTAYLALNLVGMVFVKAYIITDGFIRPAPDLGPY